MKDVAVNVGSAAGIWLTRLTGVGRPASASCWRPRAAVRRSAVARVSADRYGSHGAVGRRPLGGQGRPTGDIRRRRE